MKLYDLTNSKPVKGYSIFEGNRNTPKSSTKDKTITAFAASANQVGKFYFCDKFGSLFSYEFENFVERTKLLHKFENKLTAIMEIGAEKLLCGDSEGNLYQLTLGREFSITKIIGPGGENSVQISGRIRKLMLLPEVGYV